MGECATLSRLAAKLDAGMPASETVPAVPPAPVPGTNAVNAVSGDDHVRKVIDQQMALMQAQLALLDGGVPGGGSMAVIELKRHIIENQQALMTQQLALLSGTTAAVSGYSADDAQDGLPLQAASTPGSEGTIPGNAMRIPGVMDARYPAVPGAKLGRDPEGRPAWFVANPERPGKFLKVGG
jgi:hypothetical protein